MSLDTLHKLLRLLVSKGLVLSEDNLLVSLLFVDKPDKIVILIYDLFLSLKLFF